MGTKSKELLLASNTREAVEFPARGGINPITALGRIIKRKAELQVVDYEARIKELTPIVVNKLSRAITEGGMVSLYRNRGTRELTTEFYQAIFSSPDITYMFVRIERYNLEAQRSVPHEFDRRLGIAVHDQSDIFGPDQIIDGERIPRVGRFFALDNTRAMPEGEFEARYSIDRRYGGIGGSITPEEKLQFLEDILATEVDTARTEAYFGAPYTPGGIRPRTFRLPRIGTEWEDFDLRNIYSGYWVRDLIGQLPALPGVSIALEEATS